MLLSFIDPLNIKAFLWDGFVAYISGAAAAGYSRSRESDADALGLILATKACYNVQNGINLYNKLAELTKDKETGRYNATNWLDSHPASVERLASLQEFYQKNNLKERQKYCHTILQDFNAAGLFKTIFG